MVKLTHAEMRVLDDALDMGSGYVLDFSDRTMSEFFDDEFGITIYQERYAFNGSSKAKHMRAFVAVEDEYTVARVLRSPGPTGRAWTATATPSAGLPSRIASSPW